MTLKPNRNYGTFTIWLIIGFLLLYLLPVVSSGAPSIPIGPVKQVAIEVMPKICTEWLTIDPQVNAPLIKPGSSSSITFIVTNKSGAPVSSADITISSPGGTLTPSSGKTNTAGRFTTSFTSQQVGTFFVTASVSKSGFCSGSTSTQLTVQSTPPEVQISAAPPSPSGPPPLTVQFDGSGSSAADNATIANWSWKFSDGGTGSGKTINHTYTNQGTFTVTLQVTDSHGATNSASSPFIVSPKVPLSVMITSDPASVEQNKTSVLKVTVTGKDGNPVSGANVTLNSTQEGTVNTLTGSTDSLGQVTSNFTGTMEGNVTVTARAEKPGFLEGSRQITIRVTPSTAVTNVTSQETVKPQDLPFDVPIAFVAAIVLGILILAIVLAYLWTRSKFQLKAKQKEVPCDGKSAVSIRAQFVNGFGSLKKQRSDREIHMETTAGKVQDVIIPAGKEYVDATLTSSKECGTVTITATSDGTNKATTKVQFVGDATSIDVDISPTEIPADGNSTATIILKIKDRNGMYLAYLDEKIINLTTTLGTVPAIVKVEPKAMSGTATITSGDKKGTALIKARTGDIAGEGKIQFKEIGKRYCMHCGVSMEMEAPSCPNCGKIPPSGVDTKQCSTCNSVLPLSAKFCDKCGARQPV